MNKRKKLIKIAVHVPLYGRTFHLVIGDREEAIKFVHSVHLTDPRYNFLPPGEAMGTTFTRNGYATVIWLPAVPKTALDLAVLSHECLHAVATCLLEKGMPLESASQEAYCYMLEYLMEEFLIALRFDKKSKK